MTTGAAEETGPRRIVLIVAEGRPPDAGAPGASTCRLRVPSPDERVRAAVADGSFFEHPVLFATMESAFHAGGRLHVLASLADGLEGAGMAIVELARRHTVPQVFVHLAVGDGSRRPLDPDALARILAWVDAAHPGARIATIEGRDWVAGPGATGVRRAYDAIVHGVGRRMPTVDAVLAAGGSATEPADVMTPSIIVATDGRIRDGDVVVDALPGRIGEGIADAIAAGDEWSGFDRGAAPRDLNVVAVSGARRATRVSVAYAPPVEEGPWSALGSAGRSMRRIAWDYRLARLALDDAATGEPAAGEWWEDESSAAEPTMTVGSGDEAVLAELGRALEGDECDACLAVLSAPPEPATLRASLPSVAAADDRAGRAGRAAAEAALVVAALTSDLDGADLEIVAPGGVAVRDGDLDDVAPTLADLAGWAPLPANGTSLVAR